MGQITLDEENKKRIQKFIKQEKGFYGYEQDIELLEQNGQLTEELARKVFAGIMNESYITRITLEPEENSEFRKEIEEAFARYDRIPKPKDLEEYGFYYGKYKYMELEDIYANMQIAFELKELTNRYYGCRDLRDIAETVINSIDGIDKYKIELQPEVRTELQEIQEELRNLLAQEKTDIQAIQDMVDKYNIHAMDIWNDYLTSIDDTKSSEYRWVVHNLTKREFEDNFRDKYISTSIITNNVMGLYGKKNYGLIIKPKHIVSASYKDSYTFNYSEDEENLFIQKPPLMLPQEIEEICMQQTINANGELLNYEKARIYPEIVIDDYEIMGMYYISNGEHELARNYDGARRMAEKRGLPLIERDISKYREEHGLEPMTEMTKRNLCKNILRKCCDGDKELREVYNQYYQFFLDTHSQEFYEQYMKLKEQGDYSKDDILQIFLEITRNDSYFYKISQNLEKMYGTDEEVRKKAEQEAEARAEEQQEQLVKPREESIRDQVDDDLLKENESKKMQPRKDLTIKMWMNRFGGWYSAIDRVSQNAKTKFVKMKSDIVNAIKNEIQERENRKKQIEQQNKEEEGR